MPELEDGAGIFVGETAEALADLEFAVIRGRLPLADARRVMSEALQRVIDRAKGGRN